MTHEELQAVVEGVADGIKEYIDQQVALTVKRLEHLEARPLGLAYRGVWEQNLRYARDEGVTHAGSLWIAVRDTSGKPGSVDCRDWRLAAKRGADGKDLR